LVGRIAWPFGAASARPRSRPPTTRISVGLLIWHAARAPSPRSSSFFSLSPLLRGEGRGEGCFHKFGLARKPLVERPPHPDLLPLKGEKERRRSAEWRARPSLALPRPRGARAVRAIGTACAALACMAFARTSAEAALLALLALGLLLAEPLDQD